MTEQITTIEANERLAVISDMSVATGNVKKHDREKHLRVLRRQADTERAQPATAESLGAIGIKVVSG